ncbi:MAG TPA: SigB/SigF/SigG family RNA polymerase sigma factor [Solirubrobacteraceae bacterium]|jgi:RNA polymerase sigma-B factor
MTLAPAASATRRPGPAALRARRGGDRELVARARREGSAEARRVAVEAMLPLARSLARRYHRGAEPLEDLEQVATVGLLKAIDGFDLDRGTPFGAYAVPTIVGELRRHFRDKGWTVRVPREVQELSLRLGPAQDRLTCELGRAPTAVEIAARLEVPVERVLEAREADSAMRPVSLDKPVLGDDDNDSGALVEHLGATDDGYALTVDSLTAAELLTRLPERERRVVELRFAEDLTQTQIGERLGISQMHVSRLLRRALAELRALAEAEAG